MTIRDTAQDDVIPLSQPCTGRNGEQIQAIHVTRGQAVMIGISSFNRTKTIFGEDAHEFRPERWLEKEIDDGLQLAKGFTTLSPLLTFLGGPRGCIGYRFGTFSLIVVVKQVVKFSYSAFGGQNDSCNIDSSI